MNGAIGFLAIVLLIIVSVIVLSGNVVAVLPKKSVV
jgi:hypothetical protein